MEAIRTEFKLRKSALFKRGLQPYPDVHYCIGNFVGHINERDWWHATGKAQEAFKAIEKELLNQLHTAFKDTYSSSVHFHLFMIGQGRSSAKPTIMFFCEEKEPRKKARKVIDESGILKQLPGFRTGQQARQPDIGTLVQPAIDGELGNRTIQPSLHADVYYDPSNDIQAIGMPIFVKHSNGNWRGATAYRVFKDGQCYLMSVAHLCIESIPTYVDDPSDEDSDFDFGSEAGSNTEDDNQTTTTLSAVSDMRRGNDSSDEQESSGKAKSSAVLEPFGYNIPSSQSDGLQRLGKLHQSDVDVDWALISIENDRVLSGLTADKTSPAQSYAGEFVKGTRSMICIAGQVKKITGTFAESPSYMRLPGSRIFQELYPITLDKAIDWGDCGTLCTDSESLVSYGHIVASSEDKLTVFTVPAVSILKLSGTVWRTSTTTIPVSKATAKAPASKTLSSDDTSEESEDEAEITETPAYSSPSHSHPQNISQSGGYYNFSSLQQPSNFGYNPAQSSNYQDNSGFGTYQTGYSASTALSQTFPFGYSYSPLLTQPSYIHENAQMISSMSNVQQQTASVPSADEVVGRGWGSSPQFIFRIDEITEHPEAIEQIDENGRWRPTTLKGWNIHQQGGASGLWWYCDGRKIRLLSGWSPAEGAVPYKAFSTIYSDGHGLHVLRGDATNPPQSETWQDLLFDWDETTLSSTLTNAGARRLLRVHDPSARWPPMLLPDIYHGPAYSGSHYGGLRGDLAIFLGLIALSMRPERLATQLPKMMADGAWVEHKRSHGRTNKRGVVVYVYTCDGNDEELMEYEDGTWGNYFDN